MSNSGGLSGAGLPSLPDLSGNPFKIVAEHPNQLANWSDALEQRYGGGSLQGNLTEFQQRLAAYHDGPRSTAGTNRHFANGEFRAVQSGYYRNEFENPSYNYSQAELDRLARGLAPTPGQQGHHIQTIQSDPGRAVDPANIVATSGGSGFETGSSHWQVHHGEQGQRAAAWEARNSGGAPHAPSTPAGPDLTPRMPDTLPEPPGTMSQLAGLGGKLLGAYFDVRMVMDVAQTLELLTGKPDADIPAGTVRTDIFGNQYINAGGEWVYWHPRGT
jgi:hypothetical protein